MLPGEGRWAQQRAILPVRGDAGVGSNTMSKAPPLMLLRVRITLQHLLDSGIRRRIYLRQTILDNFLGGREVTHAAAVLIFLVRSSAPVQGCCGRPFLLVPGVRVCTGSQVTRSFAAIYCVALALPHTVLIWVGSTSIRSTDALPATGWRRRRGRGGRAQKLRSAALAETWGGLQPTPYL
jgi:hypothetical protein